MLYYAQTVLSFIEDCFCPRPTRILSPEQEIKDNLKHLPAIVSLLNDICKPAVVKVKTVNQIKQTYDQLINKEPTSVQALTKLLQDYRAAIKDFDSNKGNLFAPDIENPLGYCAENNLIDLANEFILAGADLETPKDSTPLLRAAANNHTKMAMLLINSGANVMASYSVSYDTVLICAVQNKNIHLVDRLINSTGMYLNSKNSSNKTALDYAYEKGDQGIINLLWWNGARTFNDIKTSILSRRF